MDIDTTNEFLTCHKCEKEMDLTPESKIYRQDDCDHCGAAVRCCKMCIFYDQHSYNECREPVSHRILEKDKANFCDVFTLKGGQELGKIKANHLDAANALFKNFK